MGTFKEYQYSSLATANGYFCTKIVYKELSIHKISNCFYYCSLVCKWLRVVHVQNAFAFLWLVLKPILMQTLTVTLSVKLR